jgi:xanthine dehydrogenase accessory factor
MSAGRIWFQGAGEIASGVAWRLVRCGYAVVMAEIPVPLLVRRLVCFGEVVRCGRISVEGVPGKLAAAEAAAWVPGAVTVIVDPAAAQLPRLAPDAVVDGRMTKRPPEPLPRSARPLIGLGPGFRAGGNADLVVETFREARLGSVIDAGSACADTGVPGPVAGETDRRVLRAPAAGRLCARKSIGDLVAEGEVVGTVAGTPLAAPLSGLLRGLIAEDVELQVGMKVGDIDPRGRAVAATWIMAKSLAVAGGVVEALLRLGIAPVTRERDD